MTSATLTEQDTAAPPDPAEPLAQLATEISRLEARRVELQEKHAAAVKELAAAKSTVGYMIANRYDDRAIDGAREMVARGQIDVDGNAAAIAIIERDLQTTRRKHAELDATIATRELSLRRSDLGKAIEAVDALLREFAAGALWDAVDAYGDRRMAAAVAWDRVYALERRAGDHSRHPMTSPANDRFDGFPDLRDVVDTLMKYRARQTAGQSMQQIGEAVRRTARTAHDPARQSVAAEQGDAIDNGAQTRKR